MNMRPAKTGPLLLTAGITFLAACIGVTLSLVFAGLFPGVMQELLTLDPGTRDMPPLPFFLGGQSELPLVISHDATGHGHVVCAYWDVSSFSFPRAVATGAGRG